MKKFKIVTTIILSIAILVMSFSVLTTLADVLLGDVDGNGEVNAKDSLILRQYIASWEVEINQANGDVNSDSKINAKDSLLLRKINANIVTIPSETELTTAETTEATTSEPQPTDEKSIVKAIGNDKYLINDKEYVSTFYDDFDGDKLDSSKWSICPEWERHNKNVWRNDMTSLDGNGNLVLSVGKLNDTVYKSGAIRSRGKFDQINGFYEVKVKLQSSPGFWGAFWLMPYSIDSGIDGGSDGTEIDIFESAYVNTSRIQYAVHFDGYGSRHKTIGQNFYSHNAYDGNYHVFGMEWNEDSYIFYYDGVEQYRITSEQVDISRVKNYLKVSVEAGNWAGKVDDTKLPDGITVDYVKVYQKVQ